MTQEQMIDDIEWNDGYSFDEDIMGQCWVKDEYTSLDDGGHVFVFANRKDLLNELTLFERN